MFANLKTKGFNLEGTHITDPAKPSTLLTVLALTVTLCNKTGVATLRKIAASARPAQVMAVRNRVEDYDFGLKMGYAPTAVSRVGRSSRRRPAVATPSIRSSNRIRFPARIVAIRCSMLSGVR